VTVSLAKEFETKRVVVRPFHAYHVNDVTQQPRGEGKNQFVFDRRQESRVLLVLAVGVDGGVRKNVF
jgi:hypothetical protein